MPELDPRVTKLNPAEDRGHLQPPARRDYAGIDPGEARLPAQPNLIAQ